MSGPWLGKDPPVCKDASARTEASGPKRARAGHVANGLALTLARCPSSMATPPLAARRRRRASARDVRPSSAVASVITPATGNPGGDRSHSRATTADVPAPQGRGTQTTATKGEYQPVFSVSPQRPPPDGARPCPRPPVPTRGRMRPASDPHLSRARPVPAAPCSLPPPPALPSPSAPRSPHRAA